MASFRDTSPLLARFDCCVFERVSLAGAKLPSVTFVSCEMTDLLVEPAKGPAYLDCRISVLPAELRHDAEARTRDLNDLFPLWRERAERR